ncbi:hypothetical protein B0T21DRAFT_357543 [Apiosordaria backusii]|uniref:Uncharacterized protein n=1 Tax=Apiosordaria backusii TaxID=314023 RepID=A0AA40K3G7_9PEZI|nr:hypothetical protein B0T21DRAFT_357543 [Apiosordaria backusii]
MAVRPWYWISTERCAGRRRTVLSWNRIATKRHTGRWRNTVRPRCRKTTKWGRARWHPHPRESMRWCRWSHKWRPQKWRRLFLLLLLLVLHHSSRGDVIHGLRIVVLILPGLLCNHLVLSNVPDGLVVEINAGVLVMLVVAIVLITATTTTTIPLAFVVFFPGLSRGPFVLGALGCGDLGFGTHWCCGSTQYWE